MKGVILAWKLNSRQYGKEVYSRKKGEFIVMSLNELSLCNVFFRL